MTRLKDAIDFTFALIQAKPTTLGGYGITDAAPLSHVGTGGTQHANVIAAGAAGFMTGADKTKLDGIASGAQIGTVTSVALTVPSDMAVSGSPITGSGTLGITRNNQNANTVQAGPASGAAAAPTYRALVAADLPARPTAIAIFRSGVGSTSLTAPPSAVAEPFPRLRTKFDLTNYTQGRIVAYIVTNGPTGGQIAIQYSLDQSTWNYLDNSAGPVCAVDTGSATLSVGAYVNLNAAAQADVFLRLVTQNGNASTAFVFGNMDFQFK